MTRFLIALLALLGLAAQAPVSARVSDARPAVGLVAPQRAGAPLRAAHVAGLAPVAIERAFQPVTGAHPLRPAMAGPVVPTVLTGIDRARE